MVVGEGRKDLGAIVSTMYKDISSVFSRPDLAPSNYLPSFFLFTRYDLCTSYGRIFYGIILKLISSASSFGKLDSGLTGTRSVFCSRLLFTRCRKSESYNQRWTQFGWCIRCECL